MNPFSSQALLLASAMGLLALPVRANPTQGTIRVQTLFAREADGSTGTIPRLKVWQGYGLNLNFLGANQVIKRVWLDNPGRFSLDVDGRLCERQEPNCEGAGASILHLRLLENLDFPNLTQSATQSTLLTAIAEDGQGRRTLYQFELTPARGTPQYVGVNLREAPAPLAPLPVADRALAFRSLERLAAANPAAFARQVAAGLAANPTAASEARKIRTAISMLERGSTLPEAALAAELSEVRLLQLAYLGGSQESS